MTLHVMADAETLVIKYLKTVDEVTDLVGTKVSSHKGKPYPRVSVSRIGGGDQTIPAHLEPVRLQFDCWGSGTAMSSQISTYALAATVKAAMLDIINHSHDEGVVTDSRSVLGPVWQPDPVTNQDRYLVDMLIRVHPLPASS